MTGHNAKVIPQNVVNNGGENANDAPIRDINDAIEQLHFYFVLEKRHVRAELRDACCRGDLECVKTIIEQNKYVEANFLQECFEAACGNLHGPVIEYLMSKQVNVHNVLISAGYMGNLDLIKILTQSMLKLHMRVDLNLLVRYPAIMGRDHVVDYLISIGANDFNDAFFHAAYYGQLGILRSFINFTESKDHANIKPITPDTILSAIKQVSTTYHASTLVYLLTLLHQPLTIDVCAECVKTCDMNNSRGKNQQVRDVLIKYSDYIIQHA